MSTRFHQTVLAATVLGLLVPARAAAEPVTITAGHFETNLFLGLARVMLEGDDFFLQTGASGFRSELAFCSPCAPEDPVTLSGTLQTTELRGGEARVNGVDYGEVLIGNFSGTFTTGVATLTGADQVVTLPFVFSGMVSGFLNETSPPLFTTTLSGAGIATASFTAFEGGLVNARDLRYDFTAAEPVPEPATVLLVSAGLAFAARRRMRRRPPAAEAGSAR
jgi:PEP-CTERM motif